ncbi:MAG: anthranilate synthase component I family protein [Planctomycetota bacterium]|jgi:para-aminobenzoate synthetase component 1
MTAGTIAKTDKQLLCKVHRQKINISVKPAALNELFAGLKHPSILGGNIVVAEANRFSYWSAEPKEVFEFLAGQKDPLGKLQQKTDKYRLEEDCENTLPKGVFCGGWVGYFSYEVGRYIEKLPETTIDDVKMPLIRLCFYDKVICYDHIEKSFWLIALELPDDTEKPREKLASLERLLAKAQTVLVKPPGSADLENIDFSQVRCNMDREHYLRSVEKIKRYIYDGDVYQVNFSQRFECDYNVRAIELFHWQNHYNPSPYAAYIDGGEFHIVSASPEMFITITDGIVSTKPIKGTRPRSSGAEQENARNFNELVRSEKEQAELNMIIDLERNDLVRICKYGTRKVVQRRTIESYPTVFHAVATVAGELGEGIGFCDILRAMFPGGSVTGAPKISSMEIIDETEPTDRGVYTGSIGFIGVDGNVCLNIAIRTIIITGGKVFAQVGGGIVADSVPEGEWDETITKARALLAGINSVKQVAYNIKEIQRSKRTKHFAKGRRI